VGCRASDYADLPPGAVVVVPPAGCLRRDQLVAAQEAGAGAYVTYAPGAGDGIVLRPTLVRPDGLEIPGVWASAEAARALAAAAREGDAATVSTTGRTERSRTRSVVAELPGAGDESVVMLGAHLDSVLDGPGVNDDGSGVAALLEIADALGATRPWASIRVAFWSGEELGLQGSHHYVGSLPAPDRDRLVAYLNADMVGSPNGFAGVYDEDAAAPGSDEIRDLLWATVERAGATPVEVDVHQSSDHLAFTTAGIPTGGVFSGAIAPVTTDQAEASGAAEGEPADACYHQRCDDLDNVDLALARTLTAALAEATVRLTTEP
jgi:Zn-dependent M28 family amino/carboxypeptidase